MRAYKDDDSFLLSLMRAEYGLSAEGCDNLIEAEFAGLAQNLDTLEERRAGYVVRGLAPLFGIKLMGG